MSPSEIQPPYDGSRAAAISAAVARLVGEYTGRGPRQVKTYINEDLVSVVMRDTLTKGEHSLVRDGRRDMVLATRAAYQSTMREDLIAEVEQATGRRVIAFLSDNHVDPDIAVESFILDGPPQDGAHGVSVSA